MELYIYIAIAFVSFLTGVLVGEVAKSILRDRLRKLPSAQPTQDCITRQSAIERIEWWFGILQQNPDILIDAIRTAPDAQLERKKGRWLVVDAGYIDFQKCSICGDIFDWSRKNYCPNCGSYNGGEPND